MEAARPAEGTKAPTSSASSSISLDAMHDALAYLAAFTLVAWGLIHVAPTRQVITSMEPSTNDSRLVISPRNGSSRLSSCGVSPLCPRHRRRATAGRQLRLTRLDQ